jgi:biopolymer transport protein ExbB
MFIVLAACKYDPSAATPGGDGPASDGSVEDDAPPIDAPPNAWLKPWSHRKSITIDATKVAAPTGGLLGFPVLISLTDPEIGAVALTDGSDLVITGEDAMLPLPIEIERYVEGAVTAWVRVPVLDTTADTRLYLYYGNPAPPVTLPAAVWSSDFLAVWHLSQDPGPAQPDDIRDAATTHHGTADTAMGANDLIEVGQVGPAINFDGSGDFIDVPTAIDVGQNFTLSAWVFMDNASGIRTVFSNSLSGLNIPGYRLFVNSDGTSNRMVIFETSNGDAQSHLSATTDAARIPTQVWTHVAVIANRVNGSAKIFVDGVDRTVSATIRTDFANNASVEIARMGDIFTWDGRLDEIQLSSVRREPEWILTSFTNQGDPGGFYDVGAQELDPDP